MFGQFIGGLITKQSDYGHLPIIRNIHKTKPFSFITKIVNEPKLIEKYLKNGKF